MVIQENFSLKQLNTFGIDVSTKYFIELSSISEFQEFLLNPKFKNIPKLILGGGSNILFTKNFDGIVIKNNIKGIQVLNKDNDFVYVKSGAGEVWHEFVLYCLKNNFAGVENLSLIPGSVGASPMQNIGAYGVELKEVFQSLEAVKIDTGELVVFNHEDCKFGYRESIFKNEVKDQYIITTVTFRLRKKPIYNTSYGAIEKELKKIGVTELSIQSISEAVCNIRRSKLPDPAVMGNAGSFFKNPTIVKEKFEQLKKTHPNIVGYPTADSSVKLAAGWLIEQCGWKGNTIGNAGVHKNQSLVIVNYGGASGDEIYQIALQVKNSVKEKFEVTLEMEVNII